MKWIFSLARSSDSPIYSARHVYTLLGIIIPLLVVP